MRRAPVFAVVSLVCAVAAGGLLLVPWHAGEPPDFVEPQSGRANSEAGDSSSPTLRSEALQRARVRLATEVTERRLDRNPPDPGGLVSGDVVDCRFLPRVEGGTTPKFRCVLPDGEIVKVKYGRSGEVPAEVAGTRLLSALGFGADRMHLVPRLRCFGCPASPFRTMRMLERIGLDEAVAGWVPSSRYTEFEWVAIQRVFPASEIVVADQEGWAWYEFTEEAGDRLGLRAERDALRLMAVFLAHWDNKAANQRLVCLDDRGAHGATVCQNPLAFIQDLGSTFGPNKAELEPWEQAPIWSDRAACRVTLRTLPYRGGTFTDVEISEEGRVWLAAKLLALTDDEVTALFRSARFGEFRSGRAADPAEWARAFKAKVQAIASAGPCPSVSRQDDRSPQRQH